jgi:hypothetical protein
MILAAWMILAANLDDIGSKFGRYWQHIWMILAANLDDIGSKFG